MTAELFIPAQETFIIAESLGMSKVPQEPPIEDKVPSTELMNTIVSTNQVSDKDNEHNDKAIEDLDKARSNIVAVMDAAVPAIQKLADIAITAETPEYFESLANMIEALSDTSNKLMKTHEQMAVLVNRQSAIAKQINQNNLFVGTTQEAAMMIKKLKEEAKLESRDETGA